MRYQNNIKQQAYTLIEILVALTVFAILASITAGSMYHAFNTRDRLTKQSNQMNQIQLALMYLEKDMQHVVYRPTMGPDMQIYPGFIGKANYIEFTRELFDNDGQPTLKRIAYHCNPHELIRRQWHAVDMPNRDDFHERVLLYHVTACQFAYVTHHHEILHQWRASALPTSPNRLPLPIGIQLTVTLQEAGSMTLLFPIPRGLYAE